MSLNKDIYDELVMVHNNSIKLNDYETAETIDDEFEKHNLNLDEYDEAVRYIDVFNGVLDELLRLRDAADKAGLEKERGNFSRTYHGLKDGLDVIMEHYE